MKVRLTKDNAIKYIGNTIEFKTKGQTVRTILNSVHNSCVGVNYHELGNKLLFSRKIMVIIEEQDTPQHWLIRIGDGNNWHSASRYSRWDFRTRNKNSYLIPTTNTFCESVKEGDILWFVTAGSGGEIVGMAIFQRWEDRSWIDDMTDKEIGYENQERAIWDRTLYYRDLYDMRDRPQNMKFLTHIKSPTMFRKYNNKCKVNLPLLYQNIMMFSGIRRM